MELYDSEESVISDFGHKDEMGQDQLFIVFDLFMGFDDNKKYRESCCVYYCADLL